jgi:LacI family gluconate utilization system Gnt-I transcriptional repressor
MGGADRGRDRKAAPTLANVAQLAGVSQITVSRILRNKGPIAPDTRARVMSAVQAIGYVPNRVAGSLASAGSNLMGVVIPSLSNIVFPEVLRGIHEALDESGFQPVVAVTDYDMDREEVLLRSLLAWKPAAMIIAGFDHTDATRRMLENSGIRVAELMDIDAAPIDIAVGLSHREAGHATGRHLIERGYRRFGYVGHDWHADRRARLRYDGLCRALAEAGLSLSGESVGDDKSSVFAGRDGLGRLLQQSPGVDVAVFSNDDMAVGGVFHCMGAGIVPKTDLGLFGFNGLEIGQALPVPLSTIRSDRYRIGRLAVEHILDPREHGDQPRIVDVGFEIVVGGTA